MEKSCEVACADTEELRKIDSQQIKVIVPSQQQGFHEGEKPFSKREFLYDKDQDCYYRPEGNRLGLAGVEKKTGNKRYRITAKALCFNCQHYGICTTGKLGRRIVRLHNEEIKEKLEAQYEQSASQQEYSRRKDRVEHPFGHIKRNLKTDSFLMRGHDGVQAETSLLATCSDIVRMINILGVSQIMQKLKLIEVQATG